MKRKNGKVRSEKWKEEQKKEKEIFGRKPEAKSQKKRKIGCLSEQNSKVKSGKKDVKKAGGRMLKKLEGGC